MKTRKDCRIFKWIALCLAWLCFSQAEALVGADRSDNGSDTEIVNLSSGAVGYGDDDRLFFSPELPYNLPQLSDSALSSGITSRTYRQQYAKKVSKSGFSQMTGVPASELSLSFSLKSAVDFPSEVYEERDLFILLGKLLI